MIGFVSLLAGFFLTLLAHSLAGDFAFLFLACLIALSLFLLFFVETRRLALFFTLGFCLSQEAFGTVHFGLASTLGLVLVMLHQLLGIRLNFTSHFIRYMISLALAFLAYAVLLFQPEGLGLRLLQLMAIYPFLVILFYYLSTFRQKPTYELV